MKETKPYFLSFVEEAIQNTDFEGYVAGRLEIYSSGPYADEEVRFFTDDLEKFDEFRALWDFSNVTETELNLIKAEIKTRYFRRQEEEKELPENEDS